jgi:transcriptional regulator with XRE-family HTH domain
MGTNFNKLWNDPNFIDASQKAKIDFEVSLIGKMIEAREKKGLSQRQLAEMVGIKQPAIARLESMKATPQIDTLFKILEPLGYTIKIVPKEKVKRAAKIKPLMKCQDQNSFR